MDIKINKLELIIIIFGVFFMRIVYYWFLKKLNIKKTVELEGLNNSNSVSNNGNYNIIIEANGNVHFNEKRNKIDEEKVKIISNPTQKTNVLTFGRKVNESEISNDIKNELYKILNSFGEIENNKIEFYGFEANFINNSLEINLFVRNGYNYSVWDIEAELEVYADNRLIAKSFFVFTADIFGVLDGKTSRSWKIIFGKEYIVNRIEKLSSYSIKSSYKFRESIKNN